MADELVRFFVLGALWIVPLFAQGRFDPCSVFADPRTPRRDGPAYLLQPKDHIVICTALSAQLNRHIFQIQPDGFVTLPALGRVPAGGRTLQSLSLLIARRLKRGSPSEHDVGVLEVTCRDC